VPIPSTKSLEHLSDNIRASRIANDLTSDEIQALSAIENEQTATLQETSTKMVDALRRVAKD
jgi:pyridoxine 4-dehydrogenase